MLLAKERRGAMRIGNWEVKACLTGRFRLDGGAMFGVVPKTLWSKAIPADELNRIPMALRAMVVVGEDKRVIVDAGSGRGYGEKYERIYAFETEETLEGALGRLGLAPADITDVIVTHLHFDHAGGLVFPFQEGWRLAFPEAAHHVQVRQWKHALEPNPRDRASYFRERLQVLEEERALVQHDGDWELAPGLEVLTFDGHTPGQQLLKVTGEGGTIFYCGDLIPTTAHIPVPYIMAYDLDPVRAMEEKTRVLERAVAEDWVLFFEHDPEVAACRVEVDSGRYRAGEPVEL